MNKDNTKKLDGILGANDKELTTPKHDELCLWVNKHIDIVLFRTGLYKRMLIGKNVYHVEVVDDSRDGAYILDGERVITYAAPQKEFEYVSACVTRWVNRAASFGTGPSSFYNISIAWEEPILTRNNFVVGVPDFTIKTRQKIVTIQPDIDTDIIGSKGCANIILNKPDAFCFIVEVKPIIHSIGETMRQLKIYKTFMPGDTEIVLVTQTKDVKIFNGQGIKTCVVSDDDLISWHKHEKEWEEYINERKKSKHI